MVPMGKRTIFSTFNIVNVFCRAATDIWELFLSLQAVDENNLNLGELDLTSEDFILDEVDGK